jgi:hypothetical protein
MNSNATTIYLYANAAMYSFFAIWQTLSPWTTAAALGFEVLANAARSEYLVVYGGFQFGLAAFFIWATRSESHRQAGLILALCLYVPVVPYRILSIWKFWPVSVVPLGVGTVEVLLLITGLALCFTARRPYARGDLSH